MSTITTRQNSDHQLRRLAAQRQLYGTAKKILVVQMAIAGPIAVVSVSIAALVPSMATLIGFWGWAMTLTDVLFLSKSQKRYCENAAKIQEEFDCEVLQLPWNELKVGTHPDHELVKENSDLYYKRSDAMPTLRDWYSVHASDLPIEVGRIACQRSNCWWDGEQRAQYSSLLRAAIAVCGMLILTISVVAGLTVETALKVLLLPLGPAIVLSLRQLNEHADAMARAVRLKAFSERLWNLALSGTNKEELDAKARCLQDELFEHRKRSPLVFDFVFKRLRGGLESRMNYSADEMVRQAHERGAPKTHSPQM